MDALIFKDQIFEEEEMERRTRKKRTFEQLCSVAEGGEEDGDEDGESALEGVTAAPDLSSSRLNESINETDVSDNPFLRPVRLPRTPKKQRD